MSGAENFRNATLAVATVGLMAQCGGLVSATQEACNRTKPQTETEHHIANKKLLQACVNNDLEEFKESLKEGAEVGMLNKNGENILTASMHGVVRGLAWGDPLVADYILDHKEILSQLNLDNAGSNGSALDVLQSEVSSKRNYKKMTIELRVKLQEATEKYQQKIKEGKTKVPDGTSYAFYQHMKQGRQLGGK